MVHFNISHPLRSRRRVRRVYFSICFPLRGRKTNNYIPNPTKNVVCRCSYVRCQYHHCHHAVRFFLFWPLTRKESIYSLCALCVSSPADRRDEECFVKDPFRVIIQETTSFLHKVKRTSTGAIFYRVGLRFTGFNDRMAAKLPSKGCHNLIGE